MCLSLNEMTWNNLCEHLLDKVLPKIFYCILQKKKTIMIIVILRSVCVCV